MRPQGCRSNPEAANLAFAAFFSQRCGAAEKAAGLPERQVKPGSAFMAMVELASIRTRLRAYEFRA